MPGREAKRQANLRILIVGANPGLGKAHAEGSAGDDDTITGISRNRRKSLQLKTGAIAGWICADMSRPVQESNITGKQARAERDVIDDAADATRRALTRGEAGVYHIARCLQHCKDDGTVSINKAAGAPGSVPGFRLDE